MSPTDYSALIERLGGPARAAELLGVHRTTVYARMRGSERYPITREAALAIRRLVERDERDHGGTHGPPPVAG